VNALKIIETLSDTPSGRKKPTFKRPLGAVELVQFVKGSEPVTPDVVGFTLDHQPVPLSSCFVNVRRNGRADTPRYKQFKADVDVDLLRGKVRGKPDRPRFSENTPVAVTYIVRRPDARKRDLDNLLKALNDSLTRNFILADDSQIEDLRIRWMTLTDAFYGAVHVEIRKV
jgi:Holliday junction resolvase RusA-like endonuclease